MQVNAQLPEKLAPLFDDYLRYVILEGGRGGAKSHGVATSQLIRGVKRPMLFLDAREIQRSIADSVHALLKMKIQNLGLSDFYKVLDTEIRGANGTRFIFAGLYRNIDSIKSIEDVDECWVEEAQTVSDHTWKKLIPTIRKEISPCCFVALGIMNGESRQCSKCGESVHKSKVIPSRIVLTFNPELEEDPTYQRFVISPPANSVRIHMSFRDNPWFTGVLQQEMEELKAKNYQEYLHVYEGKCKPAVEGAIFTQQLQRATEEGRINDEVEYNRSVPVHTYWDLGKSDKTAIWFCQYVGMQWRVLRCYSNFLQDLEHYMDFIEALPYTYGTHYLPHDARQDRLGMARSVEDQVRAKLGSVEVVDRTTHKVNSLEAAKAIFPLCHFHKTDCADGLSALRRYSYAMDPQTGKIGKQPKHDIYSDCADAFQCFAMAAQPDRFDDDAPVRVSYPRLG